MLGKLIKYDFKALSKYLFPIYGAMIALSFICSIMVRFRLDTGWIFSTLILGLGLLLTFSFLITVYYVIDRFNKGLLKNEGYLSFALPVKTSTHIAAKVLNALIWALLETLATGISFLIMGLIAASSKEVMELLRYLFGYLDWEMLINVVQVLLLLAEELISFAVMFYAALCIAHLFQKHQGLFTAVAVIVMMTIRLSIPTINFAIGESQNFIPIAIYLVILIHTAVYSLITWYILEYHLNLE